MLVNDAPAKASYRVRASDRVEVELPAPPVTDLVPEPMALDIVFEDAHIVVINKPAGMVVHPGAGIERGTLANGLVAHFAALPGATAAPDAALLRPGIVHRIDRDTSGLLVVAKNEQAHQHLTDQFAARTVQKNYVALVYGRVAQAQATVDLPIERHPVQRTKMSVARKGRGRNALTIYRVSRRYQEFTLLDVEIKTGRTHQIRVHLAHIGHPIVGDEVYGPGRANNVHVIAVRHAINTLHRQFLHAARLAFTHPASGQAMDFSAPLPGELNALLTIL